MGLGHQLIWKIFLTTVAYLFYFKMSKSSLYRHFNNATTKMSRLSKKYFQIQINLHNNKTNFRVLFV